MRDGNFPLVQKLGIKVHPAENVYANRCVVLANELEAQDQLAAVTRERDEFIQRYRNIELANSEMSRNDHHSWGELFLERNSFRAHADALADVCESLRSALWCENIDQQNAAYEESKDASAAYRASLQSKASAVYDQVDERAHGEGK